MILRLLIKASLVIVVFMAIGSYLVYLKTGEFWKPSWSNINISMPTFFSQDTPVMESVTVPSETTYKWRQAGQWHYGEKPPEGVEAIKVSE